MTPLLEFPSLRGEYLMRLLLERTEVALSRKVKLCLAYVQQLRQAPFQLIKDSGSFRLVTLWQAQEAFGNNAPLDLRSALFDSITTGAQQAVLPSPIVQRPVGAAG